MNVSFKFYQTKKQSRVIVRCQKKDLDISCALEIFVEADGWDSELQLLANSPIVNEKLLELKKTILSEYNNSYVTGQIIGKRWLQSIISDVFDRPSGEKKLVNSDANIYLSAFANEWLKTDGKAWKVSHNKVIGKTMLGQYQNAVDLLVEFERFANRKILMKDIDIDDFYEFVNYLQEHLDYNVSTIDRIIGRLKFFCNRASEKGIKISSAYNKRIYLEKEEDIDGVYLNEKEVEVIYTTDFSFDEKLQVAKDNLLIGIFTGLRVSDYLTRLDLSNIKDDYITITTQKTKTKVVIPLHRIVKEIIASRFGQLPPKMNEYEFGKAIKTIGMICGFDNLVYGKKWNSKTKRKEIGYYKRYELFTTHICRRSMASNLYGKIPDNSIMAVLGWSNPSMLLKYVQTTKKEHADKLQKYWENGK